MTIALTGTHHEDAQIIARAAQAAAVASLLASDLPELREIAYTLGEYTAFADPDALTFAGCLAGRYGRPRAERSMRSCQAAADAIRFALRYGDDREDYVAQVEALSYLGKAQKAAAQVVSLAQHKAPAGARGSQKGHG